MVSPFVTATMNNINKSRQARSVIYTLDSNQLVSTDIHINLNIRMFSDQPNKLIEENFRLKI